MDRRPFLQAEFGVVVVVGGVVVGAAGGHPGLAADHPSIQRTGEDAQR